MKQNQNSRRINEQAREKLSYIMLFELSDPAISLVTLTGVDSVTHQGSVQNSNPQQKQSASQRRSFWDVPEQPVSPPAEEPVPVVIETASPTLPIGEIDWDNDFNF